MTMNRVNVVQLLREIIDTINRGDEIEFVDCSVTLKYLRAEHPTSPVIGIDTYRMCEATRDAT